MTKRTTIKKVTMWAVSAPGQRKPLGIAETRAAARKMQTAYERFVKKLGKRA
jgi:hypothetical protein